MSKKLSTAAAPVPSGKVPAPVRVRLKRVNCDQAIPYPPDGQTREWWQRLMNALVTPSSAFVVASLNQLIAAKNIDLTKLNTTPRRTSKVTNRPTAPRADRKCSRCDRGTSREDTAEPR